MSERERTLEDRIVDLEKTIFYLLNFLNPVLDSIMAAHRRGLALQEVLEAKQVVTDAEVSAKMQALEDFATLEVEHSPEHEEFRRLREFIRRQAEGQ